MNANRQHITLSGRSMKSWATAIMLILGVSVVAALYWQNNVTVDKLEITGNYFTDTKEIETAAVVPFGISPDSLDLHQIKERVQALNYVKEITPFIEPNGNLRLEIKERIPLGLLVDGSNRRYVDSEGVKLDIIPGKTLDVPLIYGYNATGSDTLSSADFKHIGQFLAASRSHEFAWATISEIAFDPADGVVALSHDNGVKLIFGTDDFRKKLENWQAFYAEVVRVKGIKSIQQVDLRFSNQIVTRET